MEVAFLPALTPGPLLPLPQVPAGTKQEPCVATVWCAWLHRLSMPWCPADISVYVTIAERRSKEGVQFAAGKLSKPSKYFSVQQIDQHAYLNTPLKIVHS